MFNPTDSTSNERRHTFAGDDLDDYNARPIIRNGRTRKVIRTTAWG